MPLFGLSPGTPAALFLAIMTFIVVLNGTFRSPYPGGITTSGLTWFLMESPHIVRSSATGIVAFPFSLWGNWITLTKRPDLGGITTLMVLLSSVFANKSSYTSVYLVVATSSLVAMNYFVPIFVFELPNSFQRYLIIGSVYWTLLAIWNLNGIPEV